MESATFRKWLVEQGCRIDGDEHPRGHEGHAMVTVHREAKRPAFRWEGRARAWTRAWYAKPARSLGLIHRNCRDRRVGSEMKR